MTADFDHPDSARNRLGELLGLAWPSILARLGIMTMGLTDAIVVGHHSSRELAYHGLGWAPTAIVLTTVLGLLAGIQVMASRAVGAGRAQDAGMVLRRGLAYSATLGFGAMILLLLGGRGFISLMGIDPALADAAGRVLAVFALSLPPYLVACALMFWFEALGSPRPGMITMWVANAVNLGLALWLVPGHGGADLSGAVGAAWATFGARAVLMLGLVGWLLVWPGSRAHGVFSRRDDGKGGEQRRIGYAAGASYFAETAAFSGNAFIAGLLTPLDVAGWSIVINVAAIIFMGPLGLSSATAVLVGRAYGARDRPEVARSANLGFAVTVALTSLICAGVWSGSRVIAAGYTGDPALIALVAPALALSCLFFVADGLQVVGASALRACGDIWWPTGWHIFTYAFVMIPLSWLLAHPAGLGLNGIVWAVVAASLLSAGFLVARFTLLARRPLG